MGHGVYSALARTTRSEELGYETKSRHELFCAASVNDAMNPSGVKVRESVDSAEHPNTTPIILALDVTGSMGSVPHYLVKEGLPKMMDLLMKAGVPDPQVMFVAIGDHECDHSPLQVSQFESSDDLLDKWLTSVYLEGGGGPNDGESYLLAWYFAAFHTKIDSFDKRGKKGFIFTIGDEPTLKEVPARVLGKIMGEGQYKDFTSSELLDEANKKYHVFHLHICETSSGSRRHVVNDWKQILHENLIEVPRSPQVADIIADLVIKTTKKAGSISHPTAPSASASESSGSEGSSEKKEEEVL